DDGLGATRLPIAVAITIRRGRARIDFAGSAPQTRGPVNANLAVTRSAVLYVFTALAEEPVPPNDGLARPLTIAAPEGSIVNARFPAAVAGGDGVVREIELLVPTEVTLLAERRRVPPYGLAGGGPGATGRDWVVRDGRARRIAAKTTFAAEPGDRLRIETPGGGGFGRPRRR